MTEAPAAAGSRRRTFLLLALLLVAGGTFLLSRQVGQQGTALEAALLAQRFEAVAKRREAVWSSGRQDETGHERMAPPREGEWLWRFPEVGQTVDEYKAAAVNRRSKAREKVVLRPLGPFSPRAKVALESVRRFVAAFFQTSVTLDEERPLPDAAFDPARNQHDVAPLLTMLEGEVKEDELIRAGIADKDFSWKGVLPNFVFGVATLEKRVGVYSLARFGLGQVPEPLYRRRAFQLVAHELGHVLTLTHCIFYKCVMNGTNSLLESDQAPVHECPVCREKLALNLGFDRAVRDRELAAIFRAEGLEDEARWHEARGGR